MVLHCVCVSVYGSFITSTFLLYFYQAQKPIWEPLEQ